MGKTSIAWTDETGGPVRGCSRTCAEGAKQSGCGDQTGGGCYAEVMAWRIVQMDRARGVPEGEGKYDGLVRMTPNGPRWTGLVRVDHGDLLKLGRRKPRTPRRMFPNSMSDIFHESLSNEAIAQVFAGFALAQNTTFQVLTKRARRMREWFAWIAAGAERNRETEAAFVLRAAHSKFVDDRCEPSPWWSAEERRALAESPWPLPHLWLGVSVEHQAAADERIPELLQTPAVIRFLSCEPLIGPVALRMLEGRGQWDYLTGPNCVDWVIVGCESGDRARPCDVAWLRDLRDQCARGGVPFFLKQAVEQLSHSTSAAAHPISCGDGSWRKRGGLIELPYLDGEQHAAFPNVRPA